MLHQVFFVPFFQSSGNHITSDKSSVYKVNFKISVGTNLHRFPKIAVQADSMLFCFYWHKCTCNFSSVNAIYHFSQIAVSGCMKFHLIPQKQFNRDIRPGQSQMFHQCGNISAFCSRLFQKFTSYRRIKKQIAHNECSSFRHTCLFKSNFFCSFQKNPGADETVAYFRGNFHFCYRCYTGQCFSSEPKAGNPHQITGIFYFAGGMAKKCCPQLIRLHTAAIVRNPDKLYSAVLYLNGNGCCSCINCIFHQLFYHT